MMKNEMLELSGIYNEDKYSFLEDLLPNAYGYAKAWRPLALIYAAVLAIVIILSQFYYNSFIEWLINMTMGCTIFNILFICIMIVTFDIQVKRKTAAEIDQNLKPLRYKMSMVWECGLCVLGITALFLSSQYKKDYAFNCLDFYLEEMPGVYHISKKCPMIGEDQDDDSFYRNGGSWVKGYELQDWHTLCEACKEAAEDTAYESIH